MNSLTIIGNLTRDPESRTTNNGSTVCNFTVAVNRRQKKDDGTSEADFFRVSAWERTGEACQKYLAKGRKVAVRGSVSVHAFAGEDGTPRASLDVFAQDVEFLNSAKDSAGDGGTSGASVPAEAQPGGYTSVDNDDLPF